MTNGRPPGADERMVLPETVQAELRRLARCKRLDRGDALFLKGSMPDALFGVLQGELRVTTVGPNGREALLALLEPGHWFGEVSLFIGRHRVYDVVATQPTEVAVVEATDFHALVTARPDVHLAFTQLVCLRLRQALAWIDDAMLMPLSMRLARRITALPFTGTDAPAVQVSQEELAAMLGVTRQSVNRQLKLWQAEGVLQLGYRSLVVQRWEWLERHGRTGASSLSTQASLSETTNAK